MPARERWRDIALPLWGMLAAGLWALTAYAAGPGGAMVVVAVAGTAAVAVRRPEGLLALALVLAPIAGASFHVVGIGQSQPVRPLIAVLIVASVVYALAVARPGPGAVRIGWHVPAALGAFATVAVGSALQGVDPGSAVAPLGRLLEEAALLVAVLVVCRTRQAVLVVVAGALGGLLLAGAQGTLGGSLSADPLYGFATEGSVVTREQGSFAHPNKYGLFLSTLIPLAVSLVASRSVRPSLRALAAAALGLGLPALILSYSRGALIGLVAGSFVWLLAVRPRVALGIGLAAAVVALVVAPSDLRARFDSDSTGSDYAQRSVLWASAVDIYADHPVLGVGVGGFPSAYARRAAEGTAADRPLLNQGEGETLPFHAHNAFLTVLAEQGVLGLLALVAFGFFAVLTAFRGTKARDPVARAVCMGVARPGGLGLRQPLQREPLRGDGPATGRAHRGRMRAGRPRARPRSRCAACPRNAGSDLIPSRASARGSVASAAPASRMACPTRPCVSATRAASARSIASAARSTGLPLSSGWRSK